MEAICSSESSVLTRATRCNIPEDILHSHRRENLKILLGIHRLVYVAEMFCAPVRYELGFYIPEDGVLHSYRCENLTSFLSSLAAYLLIS
jgi:hypothetical protein